MGIKDSGKRREFETGAVRDIQEGKGRCDLLPLGAISVVYKFSDFSNQKTFGSILSCIGTARRADTNKIDDIYTAIHLFVDLQYDGNFETALLELSKHYEEGAKKYAERNWEKGIPAHCFIDSGVRHLLKWARGDNDENHERAFLWNMFGFIWTVVNKPELDDYTVKGGENNETD